MSTGGCIEWAGKPVRNNLDCNGLRNVLTYFNLACAVIGQKARINPGSGDIGLALSLKLFTIESARPMCGSRNTRGAAPRDWRCLSASKSFCSHLTDNSVKAMDGRSPTSSFRPFFLADGALRFLTMRVCNS